MRFSKRFSKGFTRTSSALCSPSWLSPLSWLTPSQQPPPVLKSSSIRCLKHLHLVGSCCILGDVVQMAAILWCGSQTSTRTPHPSASWPIVMPQYTLSFTHTHAHVSLPLSHTHVPTHTSLSSSAPHTNTHRTHTLPSRPDSTHRTHTLPSRPDPTHQHTHFPLVPNHTHPPTTPPH